MARTAKKQTVLDDVSDAFEEVTERAENALNKGWEVAFEVLPGRAEKLVRDVAKQTRKVSSDLTRRGKKTSKRLEKAVSDFEKQRQRFAKRAEKRLDNVVDAVEERFDGVVGAIERQLAGVAGAVERNVADVVRPVAQRLDLASRSELAGVKRRLTLLEKRVGGSKPPRGQRTAAGTRKRARRVS